MSKLKVAIIMGSDSDLPVVKQATSVLEEFDVPFEMKIMSAHRSPEETARFAKEAYQKGIKVIIAAAGGAAALAGVVASYFPLPVIGLPIKTSALLGLDSLFSIVQMPAGVPVATVGINGAKNAALLAVEILAISEPKLQQKLKKYKTDLSMKVTITANKLEKTGYKNYTPPKKK